MEELENAASPFDELVAAQKLARLGGETVGYKPAFAPPPNGYLPAKLCDLPQTLTSVAKQISQLKLKCHIREVAFSYMTLKMIEQKRSTACQDSHKKCRQALEKAGLTITDGCDLWAIYRILNHCRKEDGHAFGICIYYMVANRKHIVIVPQGKRVSSDRVKKIFGDTGETRACTLEEKQEDLGFSGFILPPFGFYAQNTTTGTYVLSSRKRKRNREINDLESTIRKEGLILPETATGKPEPPSKRGLRQIPTLIDEAFVDSPSIAIDLGQTLLFLDGTELIRACKATIISGLGV